MAKQQKSDLDGRDYISWLSDDILLIILSKLDLPDGARTTILSTRWRNLWTLPTSVLTLRLGAADLIPSYTKYLQRYNKSYQDTATNIKFEEAVDQILEQYKGEVIDELHISYIPSYFRTTSNRLRKPWAKVDTWVEIAKQKSVKTLDLSFELLRLCEGELHKPSPLNSLTSTTYLSLVTLRLKHPPVLSSYQIENFLYSFPNLEELSIVGAQCSLGRLRIEGASLKLKHLEIIGLQISFLRISAPNLVSFNYLSKQRTAEVYLHYVPLLAQFSYSDCAHDYSARVREFHNSAFSMDPEHRNLRSILHLTARMTNLKQLKLTLRNATDARLHLFFRLLEGSPSLCRLSLNLRFGACPLIPNHHFAINRCLEEVEIDGFTGSNNEVQLVTWIAQFSPSLKKIIIIRPSLSKYSIDRKAAVYTQQHNVISVVQLLQLRLPQLELVIK